MEHGTVRGMRKHCVDVVTDLYHCSHPHDDHCERINIFISQVMETEDPRVSDVCRQSRKAGV